jgi:polyisoprenoid-binding protein YceI
MPVAEFLRRKRNWVLGVIIAVLLVTVVAPYAYINFIQDDPPERLAFSTSTTADSGETPSTAATADSVEGTWTVAEGSLAGYRVKEILFGQDSEAVGRTSDVTGEFALDGATIESATFTVDMTTVESDEDRRDNQFHGRIMDTPTFPTATFELTEPITIGEPPADGEEITVPVTGDFTIHGVTKSVTFDLAARRNGEAIEVNGTIPVVFADYGIPDASFGPASVQDNGEIEFLLIFDRS